MVRKFCHGPKMAVFPVCHAQQQITNSNRKWMTHILERIDGKSSCEFSNFLLTHCDLRIFSRIPIEKDMSAEADNSSDSEVEFLDSVDQTQNQSSSSPPPIQTLFESVQKSNINRNIKADIIKFLNEAVDAKTKLQIYRRRLHQQSQAETSNSIVAHQTTVPILFTTSTPLQRSTSNPQFSTQFSPIPRQTIDD